MQLITVIVPVYNVELYIKKCIDSIVYQTYKDLQIILIDDGCTDRSGIICDEYAKRDNRIQVIHQEHKGASEARNAGLRIAEGNYIAFMDADDWCEPEMFSAMLKAMRENDTDAVRCNFCIARDSARQLHIPNITEIRRVSGRDAILDTCYHTESAGFGTTVWNTLFKAEIAQSPEMLLFKSDMKLGEDADWLRRYLIRCETVLLLPTCYYYYNKENVHSVTNQTSCQDQLLSVDTTIEFLTEHHFPDTVIIDRKRRKEIILMYAEINEYISNKDVRTPIIDKTSVIRDVLMKENWVLGIIKLSIVLWMIKLRISPNLVGKMWGLHRRSQ